MSPLCSSMNFPSTHSTTFNLSQGWNWIGYVPQAQLGVNIALANIPEGYAEFLKSQGGYADYYLNYGWFGTLDTMSPFEGYLLRVGADSDFTYFQINGK